MPGKDVPSKNDYPICSADISMIADDLAGACDTGFEFLKVIDPVTVVVDVDDFDGKADPSDGLIVYNTESRAIPMEAAYRKTRRASALAGKDGRRVLMKKTDSAFRGHFGREIAAVMDELDIKLCCLAVAIPKFGRMTRGGTQYLDGLPIAESFYSKDPKNPVTDSRVAVHAAVGNDRMIGLMDLNSLRGDRKEKKIADLIRTGVQIVVTDSENQEDLTNAAGLFLGQHGRILFVGGQGIAHALGHICTPSGKKTAWTPVPEGPVLVVCGTLHPRSREQVLRMSRRHRMEPVLLHLNGREETEGPVHDAACRLRAQMQHRGLGLLTTPAAAGNDPAAVERAIAATVHKVCGLIQPAGLLLTGGTTGYEACRRIGIQRLRLRREIAWGAVMAQAPELKGMAVLIKGGSLGDPEAMNEFVDTVRSLALH